APSPSAPPLATALPAAPGGRKLELPSPGEDFEYYVEAEVAFDRLRVPAPGPALPRTVVIRR
ncbi:MAG: hypothetical protein LJF30_01420, partial [Acidobacteria bacterium]|nr:hypothetical protein [Acidobacteriota bacterium]